MRGFKDTFGKKKSFCLPDLACSSFFGLLSRWSSLLLVISQWTNCCLRKHKLLVLPITGNLNQLKFERFVNQTQLIFIDKKFETFELETALSIFSDQSMFDNFEQEAAFSIFMDQSLFEHFELDTALSIILKQRCP